MLLMTLAALPSGVGTYTLSSSSPLPKLRYAATEDRLSVTVSFFKVLSRKAASLPMPVTYSGSVSSTAVPVYLYRCTSSPEYLRPQAVSSPT